MILQDWLKELDYTLIQGNPDTQVEEVIYDSRKAGPGTVFAVSYTHLDVYKRQSHSNLRSCCEVPRNLREDQFVELVRRGGLCGINLYSRFISVPDQKGEGERELLFRHIYRMLELGGEDCIAWGTDLDGQITCDPSLGSPFGAASFGTYLAERGIPEGAVKKFCFENAYRFFQSYMR